MFERFCQVQPDVDILFVKLTAQLGDWLHQKKHPTHNMSLQLEISFKAYLFCNILNVDLYIDALITELFQFCLFVSQTRGGGILWNVFVPVLRERWGNSSSGGSKWGLPWGLLCGTNGRRKECVMPCHSCYIYRIWRSKEVGGSHNLGWQCNVQGGEGAICNTAM